MAMAAGHSVYGTPQSQPEWQTGSHHLKVHFRSTLIIIVRVVPLTERRPARGGRVAALRRLAAAPSAPPRQARCRSEPHLQLGSDSDGPRTSPERPRPVRARAGTVTVPPGGGPSPEGQNFGPLAVTTRPPSRTRPPASPAGLASVAKTVAVGPRRGAVCRVQLPENNGLF